MHSGHRLSEIIAAGPLATDKLLALGAALAEIVAAAHADARVFGALSAATVFVTDQGDVRVLDAAEARISGRQEDDILALSTLLYALATGILPFRGAGVAAGRAGAAARPRPRSPIELNPSLPSGLVQLISRGVHPDAEKRFRSAGEIIAALREVRRAPGSLESLLPAEHISSSAAVKPPPRPAANEAAGEDDGDLGFDGDELEDADDGQLGIDGRPRGLPFRA